jgi:hypothetical protein
MSLAAGWLPLLPNEVFMDWRLVPLSLMICFAGYLFAENQLSSVRPSSAQTVLQSGSEDPAALNGRRPGVSSGPGATPQDAHDIPEPVSLRIAF